MKRPKRTVTLKDLAEKTGYSINTISRALRGKDDIAQETIQRIKQTAKEMATGGVFATDADICVAVTGVAGPDGGTPEKPVGTVWIAAALKGEVVSHCFHFGTVRAENIQAAADAALTLLLDLLQKQHG